MDFPDCHTYGLPPIDLYTRDRIRILHPGYEGGNTLISFPRVDRATNATTETSFGVHYGTALIACQIIAGNAFERGYLSSDKEGQQAVDLEFDDILCEDVYYLRVRDGPEKYPVVPSFRDWEFPHDRIPASWPELSENTLHPAARCGISNFSFSTNVTHLIPKNETAWYQRNDMSRYGFSIVGDIDGPCNLLYLKTDLRQCFDDRWFTITPKGIRAKDSPPQYVTHIFSSAAAELWPAYHNTVVQHLHPRARPYLFARFAWAVLLHVKNFVSSGLFSRFVSRVQAWGEGWDYRSSFYVGAQLRDWYGGGGSRAAIPMKKRARRESDADSEGSAASDL